MSQLLIQNYLNELRDLRRVSGTDRETVVREAFKDLLKQWGRSHDLVFVPEHEHLTPAGDRRLIDGALLYELRVPFGYWEAKDTADDIDKAIATKFRRGYPQDNIIFENSQTAVLFQNRQEVDRCATDDPQRLERLLDLFFAWQRPEIAEFRKAVAQFKHDLPAVLQALRERIDQAQRDNAAYRSAAGAFLLHARETINPALGEADVREMLIQHILTEEIFSKVFGEDDFHRQNNIAQKLYALEATFFTSGVKRTTLKALESYYAAIRGAAAQIASHPEKQTFLKMIYEGFYKVYNPKAADRLGVVYTPDAIVRFMIEGADWLCKKHFGKRLIDNGVEILDPATGTGTFIAELIEHFRGQPAKLKAKYLNELHANEMAILPYYVANLNIEATYAAVMGEYEEFPNLCFVDTLDNIGWGRRAGSSGPLGDLFGAMSEENVARIKRQNERKISVVIGNPPYNANQQNENENNKNRVYPAVDERIKRTYIAASTAQKTKLYDMYVRFFRWASDRIENNGIVAFISNSSFIHGRAADGLRKVLVEEFSDIYVIDLGGDVRSDPRLSGTRNNVFGIQTGVAISFLIRRSAQRGGRIYYARRPQLETAEEKLSFLGATSASVISFIELEADAHNDWLRETNGVFNSLLPIAERETKATRVPGQEHAIFKLFSLGMVTNRDDWAYDFDRDTLGVKIREFARIYESELERWSKSGKPKALGDWLNRDIKWTRELERFFRRGTHLQFAKDRARKSAYRPFCSRFVYYDPMVVHCLYRQASIYPLEFPVGNNCIIFTDPTAMKPWMTLSVSEVPDLHFVGAASGSVCLPRWAFVGRDRLDNITDWALDQFATHYAADRRIKQHPITKDAIFHYVYAALHDPLYRETYAQDLKRSFPRIPFHADFWRWAEWGETLLRLHTGYETVEPFPLNRFDIPDEKVRQTGQTPRTLLRPDRDAGTILIDSETQLTGIPPEAWTYQLGNRSALDWVLDQHKERTPKDPTIRARFNTYRFAGHKERVIDLLRRVTRVSIETVAITQAMRDLPRPP
ncbi:MAG TPA: type ISP restriction/modification enzyme [Acetobacteraceae bacterium]|jgi:predicted helicase